jgi:hypothetical protein
MAGAGILSVTAWLRKLSWTLVGSVIGANMGFKLFVALQLEVADDFIERLAFRSTGRLEPPSTFGATKTPKTLQLNPYQLPAHRDASVAAPTSTSVLS